MREDVFPYEEIVNLPHHVSHSRTQMPLHDRAAQFAPFAALTGYSESIDETVRQVEAQFEHYEREQDIGDRTYATYASDNSPILPPVPVVRHRVVGPE